MEELMPYEERIINETLNKVNKRKLKRYTKTKKNKYENYLVVYNSEHHVFVGILVKRLLNKNLASAIILDAGTLSRKLVKTGMAGFREERPDNIQLLNYEDYLKDYQDDGYDLYLQNHEDNSLSKVAYASTYIKLPIIKKLLEKGHFSYVDSIIKYSNFIRSESESICCFDVENSSLSVEILKTLKENRCDYFIYEDIIKLNNLVQLNAEEGKVLIEKCSRAISAIYSLIKRYPDIYSVESILDYCRRYEIYHGVSSFEKTINHLEEVINNSRRYGFPVDYYPNDLGRRYEFFIYCSERMRDIIGNSDCNKMYHEKAKLRKRYNYSKDDYQIVFEDDMEHLKEIGSYFVGDTYFVSQSKLKQNEYYWLLDNRNKKEKALIVIHDGKISNMVSYDSNYPDKKMKRFVSEWLNICKTKGLKFA